MSHPYSRPATTVLVVPGSYLNLQSRAVAAGFGGLRLTQPQAQYLPTQPTPTPIPIEGIPGLQTWANQFAQWAETNKAFFEASPTSHPPPPPDLENVTPVMRGVPMQRPLPSRPLPTPPSIHSGLSWSAARGFPTPFPKLGKSLAAKPDLYDGNKTRFVQWWRTVNLYLSGFKTEPTDQQKMLIILSYMKGDNAAGRFADLMVTTRGIDTMSFASFEKKLKKTFQPAALV